MPSVSVVTPFLNGLDLLSDYDAATQGAQVVIVDNGSGEETRDALAGLPPERGLVIRNETNLGFAAGNNQGYACATGDIVIFLNSDIAADPSWLKLVADDVKDGALYGPSLQYQLVAGRWLPYLEGWCIAATRATWEGLTGTWRWIEAPNAETCNGPWDATCYPGPYWEDNDLCFRALQAGLALVQTQWPIQHKGGRTAGALSKHAESFERNRATFTGRVQSALSDRRDLTTPTHARYQRELATPSDIQHHLPLLYSLARGNVVELGTRSGVSTAALLAGVERAGGYVWSVDLDDCSALYAGHPQWMFLQRDSRSLDGAMLADMFPSMALPPQPEPPSSDEIFDLILIDSEHAYEVTTAELALWSPHIVPGGHICLHDPETFPGVRRVVQEFCARTGWPVTFVLPNNGMAVIERPKA